ncbi:hypothetical protein MBLNU457_5149t1 [Dothideomycetes sp. NU457]
MKFNPDQDIPDLKGRTIVVIGGTNGLGKETILQLVKHNPMTIIFTGRSQSSADTVIEACASLSAVTTVQFIPMDLTSFPSITSGVKRITTLAPRIDIVLCIAGQMATPVSLTPAGHEILFAVNHLSHALILKHLIPTLQSSVPTSPTRSVRVIIYSSEAAELPGMSIDLDKVKTDAECSWIGVWRRYGRSKLANILYTKALARRYPHITFASIHPGISWTGLVDSSSWSQRMFIKSTSFWAAVTPEKAAWNGIWAATASNVESGVYYKPVGVKGPNDGKFGGVAVEERLWDWTQKELEGW